MSGELVAEYPANAAATNPQKEYGYRGGQLLVVYDATETGDKRWQWLVTDHLGTPRMIADLSGSLSGMKRHDYLPFGEELSAGMGIRTAAQGYPPPDDKVRQKFGTYERDNETGLDFAQARYFSNVQGRFTSPDDFLNDTSVYDPASWNLYSYVRNNPLTYTDPNGEEIYSTNLSDDEKKQLIKDWQNKTGYKNVYFDKNNKLTIDTAAGFKGGSAKAREELLAAATSTNKIFNLRSVSGAEAQQVAFADNTGVATSVDNVTGNRTDTYETRIDFGDFKQLKGDKDAKKAFTIGIALLHEFGHGLYENTPVGYDQPTQRGLPGMLEVVKINRVCPTKLMANPDKPKWLRDLTGI